MPTMDFDLINSTLRNALRKNGRELTDVRRARTPLSEVIAKEKLPDLEGMSVEQLMQCAVERSIEVPFHAERMDLIDLIRQASDRDWEEMMRGWRACLAYIFNDGPHPLAVIRVAYSLAKAHQPELVWNMSLAELAVLCGDGNGPRGTDGRATMSARIKRKVEEPIKKAGMRGCKAPYQKAASTSASYRESAKGNQNRRGREFLEVRNAVNGGHH